MFRKWLIRGFVISGVVFLILIVLGIISDIGKYERWASAFALFYAVIISVIIMVFCIVVGAFAHYSPINEQGIPQPRIYSIKTTIIVFLISFLCTLALVTIIEYARYYSSFDFGHLSFPDFIIKRVLKIV